MDSFSDASVNLSNFLGSVQPRLILNPEQVEVSLLLAARQGVKRHEAYKNCCHMFINCLLNINSNYLINTP